MQLLVLAVILLCMGVLTGKLLPVTALGLVMITLGVHFAF